MIGQYLKDLFPSRPVRQMLAEATRFFAKYPAPEDFKGQVLRRIRDAGTLQHGPPDERALRLIVDTGSLLLARSPRHRAKGKLTQIGQSVLWTWKAAHSELMIRGYLTAEQAALELRALDDVLMAG